MNLNLFKKILNNSKRPAILAGSGIKISGTEKKLYRFVKKNKIPIVTAWCHDIFPNYDNLYYGRQGTIGNRVGNFIIQNADLVVVLGSRLSIRQISYNWKNFAKKAKIISVDIDKFVLDNNLVKIDYKFNIDLKSFFKKIEKINFLISEKISNKRKQWIKWCNYIRKNFSPKYSDYKEYNKINVYHFIFYLFSRLKKKHMIVAADGAATVVPNQVGYLNNGVKYIANSGSASMGFELPAAIGASIADKKKKIICLAGDGSIMMNLQELQSIKSLNLNIIIFLINNNGYLSIKQTQKNFFKREFGSSPESKLDFPNFNLVAESFGLKSILLKKKNWKKNLDLIIKKKGPLFVVLNVDLAQEFEPKLKSKKINNKIFTPSLDDMYPFLDKKILKEISNKLRSDF